MGSIQSPTRLPSRCIACKFALSLSLSLSLYFSLSISLSLYPHLSLCLSLFLTTSRSLTTTTAIVSTVASAEPVRISIRRVAGIRESIDNINIEICCCWIAIVAVIEDDCLESSAVRDVVASLFSGYHVLWVPLSHAVGYADAATVRQIVPLVDHLPDASTWTVRIAAGRLLALHPQWLSRGTHAAVPSSRPRFQPAFGLRIDGRPIRSQSHPRGLPSPGIRLPSR